MKNREKDDRLMIPRDDFEEEASEGLGKLSREEAEDDLRELRGRIDRRLMKPRTVWLPAAAAVIIILVASALYISIFREQDTRITDLSSGQEKMQDTALIALAKPVKRPAPIINKPFETLTTKVATQAAEEPLAQEETDYITDEDVAGAAVKDVSVKEEVAEEVIVQVIPAVAPVRGIAVEEQKEKAAAQSDKKSRATVVAMPNLGVATGIHQPEPVTGMDEFNAWVEENIRYPEEVTPRQRQEVVVSFRVAPDSTLADLKAEGSPGEPFTAEAFRLLREGPKWVPAVQDGTIIEAEVKVIIIFK